jgi:hypothetical protein
MATQWAPDVQDVANLLRARTVNKNGSETGTFNGDTRPSDVEVQGLIDQAYNDVVDAIGQIDVVPANLVNSVSSIITVGAAMMVELSYYPEQVGTGRSPYAQLAAQYKDKLCRLQDAIVSAGGARPTNEFQNPGGAFGGPPVPVGWYIPTW